MINLYRLLGFHSIVQDPARIQARARLLAEGSPEREAADFLLLDPGRKECYDRALRARLLVAEANRQLGLPVTPGFLVPPAPEFQASLVPGRQGGKGRWLLPAGVLALMVLVPVALRTRVLPWSRARGADAGPSAASDKGPRPPSAPAAPGTAEARVAVAGLDPQLPPPHGWTRVTSQQESCVPWTIQTDPGQMYLVALVDARSRRVKVQVFLQGGEAFTGLVPEGEFQVYFTSGNTWYGSELRFGPNAPLYRLPKPTLVKASEDSPGGWVLRLDSAAGWPEPVGAKDGWDPEG